jgi:methionyl-tRNA synthetase
MKPFYVTSPIFYPNAQPHLGHAYVTVLCDTLARAHKLTGNESYFVTGTDEHTEKVVKAAHAQNQEPAEYLERIVERFKALYAALDIKYDQFIRTSDAEAHWPGVRELWRRLAASEDLFKGEYVGLYCLGCESFKTEKELVDGLCPDHKTVPEKLREENYFFRLSKYAAKIEQLIESGELAITPETRRKEVLTFLHSGIEDVSFSRPKEKMTWGVPVPGDESQTIYIWADALTSYISALGFGRGEERMYLWPGTHLIGKDILRFHAVFWPAMLLSAGLPLPKQIFVHGTIISGGQKMSKTIGNVIDPNDLIQKYGTDATRYLLLRHVHPFEDTDVTWERLDEWYTANLVNGLGNLVARVMKLAQTHLEQPPRVLEINREIEITKLSKNADIKSEFRQDQIIDQIDIQKIQKLDDLITSKKPFDVVKKEPEKGQEMIKELVTELHTIAVLMEPFIPKTTELIKKAVLENKKPENLFPRLS